MKYSILLALFLSFSLNAKVISGRTELERRKCSAEVSKDELKFIELSPGTIFGRHKVMKKIILKDLSSETVSFNNFGNKVVSYLYEVKKGLLSRKILINFVYKSDDQKLDRFFAIQKDIPVFGKTTTSAISCLF